MFAVLQCLPVETLIKMIERLIENALLRTSSAEDPGLSPWGPVTARWLRELDYINGFSCFGPFILEATVQVDVENTAVAPKKYLEVKLQARMRLHCGRDQSEALLHPLDQRGCIRRRLHGSMSCVRNEASQ